MNNMDVSFISASQVTLEVTDEATGLSFRRTLDLGYEENDNGIRLLGEDSSGMPSSIVFLSDTAIAKMTQLRGGGPNESPCGGHE
jgi:hypothetical protein